MAHYPTTFTESFPVAELGEQLSDRGFKAVMDLRLKGFELTSGLQEADIPEILAIAGTDAVREFCPNDAARFSDPEKWLAKGRGAFMLRASTGAKELVGYAWSGEEETEELPDHPITTAFRSTVKGTGTDLVVATVEASRAHHDARGVGLETWASNGGAVKAYLKAGAFLVNTRGMELNKATGLMEPVTRPTLQDWADHAYVKNSKIVRTDTRLFMAFPEPVAA